MLKIMKKHGMARNMNIDNRSLNSNETSLIYTKRGMTSRRRPLDGSESEEENSTNIVPHKANFVWQIFSV